MPARLVLICHAATEAVRLGRFPADEELDEGGFHALATAKRLKSTRWSTAPERRARGTALALAGGEVPVDAALSDWDLGRWRGRTLAEVAEREAAAFAAWLADPAAAPHGGESLDGLLARAASVLSEAAGRRGRSAAVTHPAMVRAAVAVALGAGATAFWRIDAMPLATARLSHDGRRWSLQALVPPAR